MKIAVVRRRWVSDGGGERFAAALAGALADRGHDVTIVSSDWMSSNGPVRCERVPTIRGRGELLGLLSFTLGAAQRLRAGAYDLVQSHEKLLWQDVYRAGDGCHREWLRQRRRHRPGWRTRLAPWTPYHRLVLALEHHALGRRRYRKIIANSERGRTDLQRHYGVPAGDVRVVYNGVDLERFAPARRMALRDAARTQFEIPRDVVLLLFLGSGFERKGLAYLLRSLRVSPEDVWAVVVGHDLYADTYRALAERLGVARRVRFAGALAEPERAYAAADAFVLPTIYEPFSNACLEALASGLPVITTRANGASEIFTGGLRDLVVDEPGDEAALASRIAALRERDFREALGREARRAAEARPLSRAIDEFLAVYRELEPVGECQRAPAASR
jgi:UDP-glucose:(heptosyl)LPS alpha-1,3-glucosyltransferase